ncbi:MAG TPA: chorismate mutase [Methanocorpusculum sp.]|nr:chorismate mutase [Methanocorpusculum sp.]
MSEIDELRSEIAGIDAEIVALVGKRIAVAKEIGAYKRENGLPVIVPDVEAKVRNRYVEEARKAGVPEDAAERIADILITACRSVQE